MMHECRLQPGVKRLTLEVSTRFGNHWQVGAGGGGFAAGAVLHVQLGPREARPGLALHALRQTFCWIVVG